VRRISSHKYIRERPIVLYSGGWKRTTRSKFRNRFYHHHSNVSYILRIWESQKKKRPVSIMPTNRLKTRVDWAPGMSYV
jgi:hypothetical protein